MKVNFLTENIQEKISLLGKTLPSHAPIPVLTSILIEATKEGLFLSATDLEFGITVQIPAKIEEEGGVLIPGKQFIEIINSLGKEKATFTQEKDQMLLETQTGTFKFQAMPKDEFPKMFEEKGEKIDEYTKEEFTAIFSRLTFAVSTDSARPHLTGIYIVKKEKEVHFVATDGYRLSLVKTVREVGEEVLQEGIIVSPQLISEALSLKSAEKISLFVYKQGNQFILEADGVRLVGRLIEGVYPEYARVVPGSVGTAITVDVGEFLKVVRAVSVFARENANVVKVDVKNGTLTLSVPSTSIGEAESVLEGTQEGPDGEISFNSRYLSDLLRVSEGKKIKVGINSSFDPSLFTIPGEESFLHVIMPVKVQD